MLLESNVNWQQTVESKIKLFEQGFAKLSKHLSLPELVSESPEVESGSDEIREVAFHHASSTSTEHRPHGWEIIMDPESGPAAIPGSVVSPIISAAGGDNRSNNDIISRGIISTSLADDFLNIYQNRLDHFLYRILGDRRTLGQIRASSALLLSAVSAVGALHLAAPQFETLYQEFVSIASAQSFSRKHTTDDVRGLCIGAFWLSGISWACIGSAVRISTELQLHRSVYKAIEGDHAHYLRTRLYYLVYVCDHHFSIPYGRPPMTPTCDVIRAQAQFLESKHAVEDDARLVSQVRFWMVGAEVYDTFGSNVELPLTLALVEPLRRYGIKFDNIRADWSERFLRNKYVGNYPRKGVGLHYHFAKLYLYSHAFRGVDKPGFKSPEIALDIDELANSALLSATSILRAVISDTEIQGYLNGLPTYFDLMIAFAVVFLLKLSTRYASFVRVDVSQINSLVAEVVVVLKTVTANMHPRHILVSVANGAETLLQRSTAPAAASGASRDAQMQIAQPTFEETLFDMPSNWSDVPMDNFFMGEFDFLSTQGAFMES